MKQNSKLVIALLVAVVLAGCEGSEYYDENISKQAAFVEQMSNGELRSIFLACANEAIGWHCNDIINESYRAYQSTLEMCRKGYQARGCKHD